jgi:hypothetical protein
VITAVWSPMALVSLGQSAYSLYGLVLLLLLGVTAVKNNLRSSISLLINLWFEMLVISYTVAMLATFLSEGSFRLIGIDEAAILSFVLIIIAFTFDAKVSPFRNLGLFWMFIAGQSLSSVISSLCF